MSARTKSSRWQRQRRFSPPQRQRGIALLVAILLVALGTILAAAVAYENAMTARRGTATYAFDESILIQQGAEALAAYGIRQIHQSDPSHIYLGQGWDKPLGPLEVVPGVMLEAHLEDMQGRFNLNALVKTDGTPDQGAVATFENLLALVGLEPKWAPLLVDWIDYDIQPQTTDGAEDSVYMGQTPPYRTANRYITSPSEMLALPGFGRDRYVALAPYITALPPNVQLNVCTAPGLVLDAWIGSGHTEFSAGNGQQLAQNRSNTTGCFPTTANFTAAMGPNAGKRNTKYQTGTTSNYFRLTSYITIGSTEFSLYSLMYLDPQSSSGVRAIQRSFTAD